MAAKEIEALPAFTEVNHLRLLRMQLQPQTRQNIPGELLAALASASLRHATTKIVRIADECAVSTVNKRLSSACR